MVNPKVDLFRAVILLAACSTDWLTKELKAYSNSFLIHMSDRTTISINQRTQQQLDILCELLGSSKINIISDLVNTLSISRHEINFIKLHLGRLNLQTIVEKGLESEITKAQRRVRASHKSEAQLARAKERESRVSFKVFINQNIDKVDNYFDLLEVAAIQQTHLMSRFIDSQPVGALDNIDNSYYDRILIERYTDGEWTLDRSHNFVKVNR